MCKHAQNSWMPSVYGGAMKWYRKWMGLTVDKLGLRFSRGVIKVLSLTFYKCL